MKKHTTWIRPAASGAAVGIAATLGMSALMLVAGRFGLMQRQPPEEIVRRTTHRSTGEHLSESEANALGSAAHLAFGAMGGAAYGLLWTRTRPRLPAALLGIVYATGVWAVSYLGWLPALDLMPRPDTDEPRRPLVMVAAHWVYGAMLGTIVKRLAEPGRAHELACADPRCLHVRDG